MDTNQPKTMAVIGAGGRGTEVYTQYAHYFPHLLQISAVAEPNDFRRKRFAEIYNVPEEMQFKSCEEMFEKHTPDSVLIATPDSEHYGPILRAMEAGCHILAEKPITNNLEELLNLRDKILNYDKVFLICHVLRYTMFFENLKQILNSGKIGELVTVQHNENVGHFHQAHSFVRGNWRNSKESSPMILQKCCHDMDILNFLIDKECVSVSSYGSLSHFKKEKAPEGATKSCLHGCPHILECPYSAALYIEAELGEKPNENVLPFIGAVKSHWESDDLLTALSLGPYGRCVYHCDNNVVDHQVVNIKYENGVTVAFTMTGFTNKCSRTIKIMGTKGEIRGHMEKNEIIVTDFRTGLENKITYNTSEGHGGGDQGIICEFMRLIQGDLSYNLNQIKKNNKQGIDAHLMSFAAEKSRLEQQVVKLQDL